MLICVSLYGTTDSKEAQVGRQTADMIVLWLRQVGSALKKDIGVVIYEFTDVQQIYDINSYDDAIEIYKQKKNKKRKV
jgi:hypothetical protein